MNDPITIWVRTILRPQNTSKREIFLTVTNGEQVNEENFTVMDAFYSDELSEGTCIDEETYDLISLAAEATSAAMKGADLLELRDHTKQELQQKLQKRGFGEDAALCAVRYLESRGAIRERDLMERTMRYFCDKKYWGPAKINAELSKRGFSKRENADVYQEMMETLDFAAACAHRIRQIGPEAFTDPKTKQKHYAALMRQGFYSEHIRRALTLLEDEDD